jgi:hypothetical protein
MLKNMDYDTKFFSYIWTKERLYLLIQFQRDNFHIDQCIIKQMKRLKTFANWTPFVPWLNFFISFTCYYTSLQYKFFPTSLSRYRPQPQPTSIRLEWTNSHQCTNWGWGHSNHFEDEPKTHPLPLPRDFSSPFLYPKIFPSYLPPPSFPVHSVSRAH